MNTHETIFPSTFIQHASVMGRFILGARISERPVAAAAQIQEEFKTASRYLKMACSISQSKALEVLSIASGFKHWHELQMHLKKATAFDTKAPDDWAERFCLLTPLLVDIERDLPPSDLAQIQITHFAARAAQLLGCSPLLILDGVFARLCHDSQWSTVISRNPIDAHEPFYRFVPADTYSSGHFVQSRASLELYEKIESGLNLDDLEDLNTFVERLILATQERPDYIEGWLYAAEILREEHPDEALRLANAGIAAAEALLPKGFRAKLEWGYHENRHYLRLIQQKLLAHEQLLEVQAKGIDQAIKSARKLARLSPDLKKWVLEKLNELIERKNQNSTDLSC